MEQPVNLLVPQRVGHQRGPAEIVLPAVIAREAMSILIMF
jgi:hypothetical protein